MTGVKKPRSVVKNGRIVIFTSGVRNMKQKNIHLWGKKMEKYGKKWEKYDWNIHLWGQKYEATNMTGILTSGAKKGRHGIFTSGVICIILPSTLGSSLQATASN